METPYFNIIRLEFNEDQQQWHFARETGCIENTFNWFTVVDKCTKEQASKFIDVVKQCNQKKITKEWLLNFAQTIKQVNN